jgi:hypothetical protein
MIRGTFQEWRDYFEFLVLEPVPVDDHHVETVENLMDQCRSKMQEALSELKCIKD